MVLTHRLQSEAEHEDAETWTWTRTQRMDRQEAAACWTGGWTRLHVDHQSLSKVL